MSIAKKSILLIFIVLLIDQVLKIIIKTNMTLYQDIHVLGDWFIIKFIENDGMAFGLDLPGDNGKLILTLFRIVAVTAIAFYIRHLIRIKAHNGLILSMALILAGAFGNIIDSVFYGVIFSQSLPFPNNPAVLFPENGGYGTLMHGHVVDMFYFPIIQDKTWPEWIPFVGGNSFEFFRPVFNIADSSISIGVFIILFFQKSFFHHETEEAKKNDTEEVSEEENTEPAGDTEPEKNPDSNPA